MRHGRCHIIICRFGETLSGGRGTSASIKPREVGGRIVKCACRVIQKTCCWIAHQSCVLIQRPKWGCAKSTCWYTYIHTVQTYSLTSGNFISKGSNIDGDGGNWSYLLDFIGSCVSQQFYMFGIRYTFDLLHGTRVNKYTIHLKTKLCVLIN